MIENYAYLSLFIISLSVVYVIFSPSDSKLKQAVKLILMSVALGIGFFFMDDVPGRFNKLRLEAEKELAVEAEEQNEEKIETEIKEGLGEDEEKITYLTYVYEGPKDFTAEDAEFIVDEKYRNYECMQYDSIPALNEIVKVYDKDTKKEFSPSFEGAEHWSTELPGNTETVAYIEDELGNRKSVTLKLNVLPVNYGEQNQGETW